jgi:anti-sigma factor RsiW
MADVTPIAPEDCERARAEVHAFMNGTGPGAKSPALRTHLARCPDCDAHYRELVVGVARIASGARVAAEVRQQDEVASNARRSLIAAESRHRIRLPKSLLPLAVVALIAILVMKSGVQGVTLRALEGTVFLGTVQVAPGTTQAAANGAGCSTGADGHARLARGDDAITIEPDSSFTIERADRLAIRLLDGRASIEGSALIVCSAGALDVQAGAARVHVDDAGITVEALRGVVEYTDAEGRAVLPPGTRKSVELARLSENR